MAKRKRSSRSPQPQHKKTRQHSQHDRCSRTQIPNPNRRKTSQARVPLVGSMLAAIQAMATALDPRVAFRLPIIASGMLLASDRRTASSWFSAAGVHDDWDLFYGCLIGIGLRVEAMAARVLSFVLRTVVRDAQRIVVAIDDTPSKRQGKHVEGAGVHHNPTPGPADGDWMYGHNWVSLAVLVPHRLWGVIALPLRSLLYVRQVDVPKLDRRRGWEFRTKHQLAVELMLWFVSHLRAVKTNCAVWVVADGAYAARPFIDPVRTKDVVVVSRLRKDARLFDLPAARQSGERGRPRIYGTHRISLTKRAANRRGWESITYTSRGQDVTRSYKTFVATSRLVGGQIRVVLVKFEDRGWAAYFCTDPTAEPRAILEAVASRWALEEHFHDVKEVWGAGKQQVRNVWSNVGCWHLNQWMYTLVELTAWDQSKEVLSDRSDRPWDNAERRPSHADRRRAISREMLENEFLTHLPDTPETQKFRALISHLISLSA